MRRKTVELLNEEDRRDESARKIQMAWGRYWQAENARKEKVRTRRRPWHGRRWHRTILFLLLGRRWHREVFFSTDVVATIFPVLALILMVAGHKYRSRQTRSICGANIDLIQWEVDCTPAAEGALAILLELGEEIRSPSVLGESGRCRPP